MIHLDRNPSEKKLRQFGNVAPIMLLLIACILRWRFDLPAPAMATLCAVGILIFLTSKQSAKLVRPVYLLLVLIGFPIGWVISHLIMLLFYYLIITPIALFFRLIGRDALQRRWNPESESYWTEHSKTDNVRRYFKQF